MADRLPVDPGADPAWRWAASGMLSLTGPADGPGLGAPLALIEAADRFAADLARHSSSLGRPVDVDPLALLAERAALTGLGRRGTESCGGSARLLPCRDGWVAATMARPSDWELVPALLGLGAPVAEGDWEVLGSAVAARDAAELRQQAGLLGLALAVLGEREPSSPGGPVVSTASGVRSRWIRAQPPFRPGDQPLVADLSALWAGPLVGRLLARTGARVVKVESVSRPDGARRGHPAFYRALNAGKASVALDLGDLAGRELLARVVARADVVITASRPRALEHLGLDPATVVRESRPKVWLTISGYGNTGEGRNRVAFGDDAAVAGGLVAWDGPTPCFCGDAIADPLTGLAATAAVVAALDGDGAWVIDASLADVAGGGRGPAFSTEGLRATPPPTRPSHPGPPAPTLGADTDRVLTEWGIR